MSLHAISLDDKYTRTSGRIFLSGIQALVRLPIMQRQRDAALGLNTGGFISGYQGSPIGGYDMALSRARRLLHQNNVHFQPGINEDLAATAVWGSQQVGLVPGATVDGVFGIWYGKSPGVDRSGDALKHANAAGTSVHGGVIAVAGDDHACESSTLPNQSDYIFEAAMIPILSPANVQDYLDFGMLGFAMSRFSGCWIGFKALAETVESSASVDADPHRVNIIVPEFEMPPGGLNIRMIDPPIEAEQRLHGPKMAAIAAFARANKLDRWILPPAQARLGIVTSGKAYLDVKQALSDLGITDERAKALGIRIYKLGMVWPLQAAGVKNFAEGLQDILVVEEKRSFIEAQLVQILYNVDASRRPSVVGKRDESGKVLLPSEGVITPTMVAQAIVSRLKRLGEDTSTFVQPLARLEEFDRQTRQPLPSVSRSPFFCSGCPHNSSTKIPDGSRAMAGIGCHALVRQIPARNTNFSTHMGAEGANWIGQAPFTTEKHVFQNLGDGTYSHSGLLAIRAAAAAGVSITYKILYNDAVAMTGGQAVEGGFGVPQVARQVDAEGAKRIVVVTDEPDKYPADAGFPPNVAIRHRDDLDAVQRELREIPGLTVLIYDQTCAAEKRRRRKRKEFVDPPKRVFINQEVCEGCGDCSVASNCVSVKPIETELGRKRAIDQSNCNKDFSCLKGFCPSFVTVLGGTPRKLVRSRVRDDAKLFNDLPLPERKPIADVYSILITGVGGTGVLTISALLGMAAHIEGLGCSVLDNTGSAQKNGAVTSHVRLAPHPEDLAAVRIATGGADLLLACDMMVAATDKSVLSALEHGVSHAVVNSYLQPMASYVINPDIDFEAVAMKKILVDAIGKDRLDMLNATGLASTVFGDGIATNAFMLGFAFQKGLIPLSLDAIEKAIELNGVAIETNKRTLFWGRLAAFDLPRLLAEIGPVPVGEPEPQTLAEVIERRKNLLAAYQDAAYARQYAELVEKVEAAEKSAGRQLNGLTDAVARNLYKLMAYKDEYEVARLYTDGTFADRLNNQFEGNYKLQFHLAPPLFAGRDPATGHLKKHAYGAWIFWMFKLLRNGKHLRGTAFDVFGYSDERRMERRLVDEYKAMIREIAMTLTSRNHAVAVELARVPEQIRGYGHIKDKSAKSAKQQEEKLLERYRAAPLLVMAAAE